MTSCLVRGLVRNNTVVAFVEKRTKVQMLAESCTTKQCLMTMFFKKSEALIIILEPIIKILVMI